MSNGNSAFIAVLHWIADNPHAPYYVMAFISTVFACLLGWFIRQLVAGERDVRGLYGLVTSGNTSAFRTEAVDQSGLGATAIIAQAKLVEVSPIARRVRQYCSSLVVDYAGTDRVRASRSAAEIFDFDALIREAFNLRLLQAIPNVLVGIGLLFTFLGLTAALYFASQGAGAHDVAQTEASIRNLLDAAAFKFSSSLIALLLSIVFLFTERIQLRRYQRHVLRLAITLDELFPSLGTEELLRSLLDRAQEQLSLLTDVGPKTTLAIAEKLDATLGVRISDTFDRLNVTITNIGQTMYEANEAVLESILDRFALGLTAKINASFVRLLDASAIYAESLQARADAADAAISRISEVGRQVSGEADTTLGLFNDVTLKLIEVVEGLGIATDKISGAAAPIKESANAAKSLLVGVRKAQDQATSSLIKLQEVAEGIQNAASAGAEANDAAVKMLFHQVRNSSDAFKASLSQLSEQTRDRHVEINADLTTSGQIVHEMISEAQRERLQTLDWTGRLEGQLEKLHTVIAALVMAVEGSSSRR